MASAKRSKLATPARETTLAHRIHALLNTVRLIGHAEDELCTLLHEAEHGRAAAPALTRELAALLAKLPAQDYVHDLEALQGTLAPAKRAVVKSKPVRAKKPAARKLAGKKFVPRKTAATKTAGNAKPAVKRRARS